MVSKIVIGAALAAAALLGPQAQAGYVTATYQGTINTIYDGDTFYLGEPIDYSMTFDPGRLVDRTGTGNAGLAAISSLQYGSILTDSLSDDPLASLTITVGNETFTKFNQAHYGTPTSDTHSDLGVGNFPLVEYLNGAFAGVGGVFIDRAAQIGLYTDPIGAALDDFDGHAFYIGDSTSDAEGDYDIRNAVFTVAAVPEPASWAMMIGGFGMVGGAMRRRPRAAPVLA